MAQVKANGLQLELCEEGRKEGPPLIHISGIFSQLVRWDQTFFDAMAGRGLRMIRYDNRDVGLSEKLPQLGRPDVMELIRKSMTREPVTDAPYTLHDMADDCIGVLDALQIETAHIQGESMGGMIAQIVAAKFPDRVRSLISVMSSSGRAHLPPATPEAQAVLFTRAENPDDREEVLRLSTQAHMLLSGPGFDAGADYYRGKAEEMYNRGHYPGSGPRHLAAAYASIERAELLQTIKGPTLVVHGSSDPLIPVEHAHDTAELIPGAELCVIEGMSHYVESGLAPVLAARIGDFIAAVEAKGVG